MPLKKKGQPRRSHADAIGRDIKKRVKLSPRLGSDCQIQVAR